MKSCETPTHSIQQFPTVSICRLENINYTRERDRTVPLLCHNREDVQDAEEAGGSLGCSRSVSSVVVSDVGECRSSFVVFLITTVVSLL